MKLTDREWKEFKVGNLFEIEKCKCSNVSLFKKGSIPYIGATNKNNGTISFIDSGKKYITKGNCIVFICDGQGSVGYSIYKKENFVGSTTLKVGRNLLLNKYNALFFTTALDKNRSIYSYGYKRNENRLKNEHILLPITSKDEPDYKFMEDYVKEIMHRKRQEYIDYAKVKLEQNRTEQIIPLHSKKWKEFFVIDIFPFIQRGKRLIKDKQISGSVPYVSSTATNNGVDNFVQYDASKMRKYQNCLSVANSGSVGASFYEPFEYVASDHVTHLKNDNFNKNIYLFISVMTGRWSQKYNFNREINDLRISREKILLPVNNNDEPDYAYMEQYVNNILMQKYNDYLEYAEKSQNI